MIKLGQKVKDNITGFKGIAIARCEYLNGCISIEVQPIELKDGRPIKAEWIDEQRLTTKSSAKTGGPGSIPAGLDTPES